MNHCAHTLIANFDISARTVGSASQAVEALKICMKSDCNRACKGIQSNREGDFCRGSSANSPSLGGKTPCLLE